MYLFKVLELALDNERLRLSSFKSVVEGSFKSLSSRIYEYVKYPLCKFFFVFNLEHFQVLAYLARIPFRISGYHNLGFRSLACTDGIEREINRYFSPFKDSRVTVTIAIHFPQIQFY